MEGGNEGGREGKIIDCMTADMNMNQRGLASTA